MDRRDFLEASIADLVVELDRIRDSGEGDDAVLEQFLSTRRALLANVHDGNRDWLLLQFDRIALDFNLVAPDPPEERGIEAT
jgi:hypothetical protein